MTGNSIFSNLIATSVNSNLLSYNEAIRNFQQFIFLSSPLNPTANRFHRINSIYFESFTTFELMKEQYK